MAQTVLETLEQASAESAQSRSAEEQALKTLAEETGKTKPAATTTTEVKVEDKKAEVEDAPEEVDQEVKDKLLSLLSGRIDEPKKEKPDDKKETAKEDKPKPENKPDKGIEVDSGNLDGEGKKVKSTRRKAAMDQDPMEIAAMAAARATAEIAANQARAQEKKADAGVETKTAELPPKYQKRLEVFREMAASNPERYGNLPNEFVSGIARVDDYKINWERENPKKAFNPDDEEHEDFFAAIEPSYDEDDYHDARTSLKIKPLEKEAKRAEQLERELSELKQREEVRAKEPELIGIKTNALSSVLEGIDPELLKAAQEKDAFDKYRKSDPYTAQVGVTMGKVAGEIIAEGVRILDGNGKAKIDQANDITREFFSIKGEIEAGIKSLPAADQYNDSGQRFATWSEYAQIVNSRPELADRYWFLGKNELRPLIAASFTKKAKDLIKAKNEEFNMVAEARGMKVDDASKVSQNGGKKKADYKPENKGQESPSAPEGRTSISAVADNSKKSADTWQEMLLARLAGR